LNLLILRIITHSMRINNYFFLAIIEVPKLNVEATEYFNSSSQRHIQNFLGGDDLFSVEKP